MSNVGKFEELLRSDEALQAKLGAAAEAFEGDKADERAVFDAIIAPLADEADLPFTYDDALAFAKDGAVVDEGELDAVAGGSEDKFGAAESVCFIAGGGFSADGCSDEKWGVGACAGIGVGFLGF